MDGVLNIHKTAGPTSHDVVDAVRHLFGQKRVGHAGTLDPMATGVLVVCLGKATRVVEYLMDARKQYRARMVLGQSTHTQDSTGRITEERDAAHVTREALEEAAGGFAGEIWQVPPMVSALQRDGKRLYQLAREGKIVDRPARRVDVYAISVLDWVPGERPEAELQVDCSSGTYIRTLCADIGDKLGCRAHMSMLERTRVGRFVLKDAVSIDDLAAAREQGGLERLVISIDEALADLPSVTLDAHDAARAAHGLVAPAGMAGDEGETVRILSPNAELIGLGVLLRQDDVMAVKPRKVLAGEGLSWVAISESPPQD